MARWYDHDACSSGHVSLTGRLFWQRHAYAPKHGDFVHSLETQMVARCQKETRFICRLLKERPAASGSIIHIRMMQTHLQPIDQLGQSPPLQDHLDGVPW